MAINFITPDVVTDTLQVFYSGLLSIDLTWTTLSSGDTYRFRISGKEIIFLRLNENSVTYDVKLVPAFETHSHPVGYWTDDTGTVATGKTFTLTPGGSGAPHTWIFGPASMLLFGKLSVPGTTDVLLPTYMDLVCVDAPTDLKLAVINPTLKR